MFDSCQTLKLGPERLLVCQTWMSGISLVYHDLRCFVASGMHLSEKTVALAFMDLEDFTFMCESALGHCDGCIAGGFSDVWS